MRRVDIDTIGFYIQELEKLNADLLTTCKNVSEKIKTAREYNAGQDISTPIDNILSMAETWLDQTINRVER